MSPLSGHWRYSARAAASALQHPRYGIHAVANAASVTPSLPGLTCPAGFARSRATRSAVYNSCCTAPDARFLLYDSFAQLP